MQTLQIRLLQSKSELQFCFRDNLIFDNDDVKAPYFLRVNLNQKTCKITDKFSTTKIPAKIGSNNSFLIAIAITAIIPPIVKLPVSPIKTWAGKVLYQRNPIKAPAKASIKTVISPELGIYITSK